MDKDATKFYIETIIIIVASPQLIPQCCDHIEEDVLCSQMKSLHNHSFAKKSNRLHTFRVESYKFSTILFGVIIIFFI